MDEFIKQGDNIIVNADHAEAYIPYELFKDAESAGKKSTIVGAYGEGIKAVGIFNMRFFDSTYTGPESIKNFPLRTFVYPNMIETYPTSYSEQDLILDDGLELDKYLVLFYDRGDIMMPTTVKKDSQNCEKFMSMISAGKIPVTIGYDEILKAWETNFAINGVNPGVPSVIMQCIISEKYRYKKNPIMQFRKIAGKGPYDKNSYIIANMREVASYSGVFNALTFEDMGAMLTTSLLMSRRNEIQNKSPIEKVLS
jgi:hypothetical protein